MDETSTDPQKAVIAPIDEASPSEPLPASEGADLGGRRGSRPTLTTAWRWAQDAVAIVVLLWPLMWFSDNDGGRALKPMADYVLFLIPAAFVLAGEARRLPRLARFLIWSIPLGALISFAFAWDRALWVKDAQIFASMPIVALAAARLWRREQGHRILTAILVIAWSAWFWNGMLRWWGWTDLGLQPRWELVSWRNQSGMLSGAFALFFAGAVLLGRRLLPPFAVLLSASGFAGLWLSGSRAAVAITTLTLIGLVLVALGLTEGARNRVFVVVRAVVTVGVATAIVAGMSAMIPEGRTSPLAAREQEVGENAIARTKHWSAAVGMFLERPITGQGIGSYRGMATRHTPSDANLTASAHNEWLEAFAEGGIVQGVPMALLGLCVLLSMKRSKDVVGDADQMVDEPPESSAALRKAALLGALGTVAAIGMHTSIDFDLRYPTIALLFAAMMGIVGSAWPSQTGVARHERERPTGRELAVVMSAVVLLSAASLGGWRQFRPVAADAQTALEFAEAPAPWDTGAHRTTTARLIDAGQLEAANVSASRLLSWNPGNPQAKMDLARVEHLQGRLSAEELVDMLEAPPTWLGEWVRTAQTLLRTEHYGLAEAVARTTIDFHPEYRSWGITGHVANAWIVRMEISRDVGLCRDVPGLLAQAQAQDFDMAGGEIARVQETARELCPAQF